MEMTPAPAVVVLGPGGLDIARKILSAVPEARLHGLAGRVEAADVAFESLADHLRGLFQSGVPIIGVCAAGILIRALAPVIGDKGTESAVLAVAQDGSAVVPLLGGHRGANDLARHIAAALDTEAAVTTAGDVRFGVALDAPPGGWRLANPADVKPFVAQLLSGEKVRIEGDAPWLADSGLPMAADGGLVITVTDGTQPTGPRRLVYHPAVLAVGVGCERNLEASLMTGLVRETLAAAGLAEGAVAGVFSIDVKMDEAAVHAVAGALGVPARFFDSATLEAETPRLANPSDVVYREVGCHGVAEAAALAAAGADADLIAPKRKSRGATCAVARGPRIIDAGAVGRPRGSLAIVGIGPGAAAWRTPEADAAIGAASDLVGYGRYLDLLGALVRGRRTHAYALGEESARVRGALDLAAEGRCVALFSSGDAGIYAMAALVFELLEQAERVEWRRIAVTVVPGVSAMQAAAARIGAPLGHDFCAISLSDLLTPWTTIEDRLHAAARGDFVIALYNPASERRRHRFARAREVLLEHRRADTPVVLARNLGRDGETVDVVTLGELAPDRADMLTLVLVGSSATRLVHRGDGGLWVYTPRGYAAKSKARGAA